MRYISCRMEGMRCFITVGMNIEVCSKFLAHEIISYRYLKTTAPCTSVSENPTQNVFVL